MSPGLQPTIRVLGLQRWLNLEIQREMHNGHGYEDYAAMMDDDQPYGHERVSAAFGVAIRTVFYWEKQEKLRLAGEAQNEL